MALLNRTQYLQARTNIDTAIIALKNVGLADYVATIDQALADGPAKNPKMWADGADALRAEKAKAENLLKIL